ncbi:MAG: DUF4360 domain-containing protein [Bdellovibrionaceae bacterium]|nr:DUF4360 domain-containing protein [Pseudobdellovibrionaceae bacterium]MDW8191052.1 DUF4360 domain-containing protein [Pseudobdellovibrionaceae bacterium]
MNIRLRLRKKGGESKVTWGWQWLLLSTTLVLSTVVKGQIQIRQVTWQGSGCDFQSVSATVSPDLQELSLLFDKYRIQLLPHDVPTVRKECYIYIDVEVNPGISFAFKSVDYRGFRSIPSQVEGYHRLAALLEGQRVPHTREIRWVGPSLGSYFHRVEAASHRLQFSDCSKRFHRIMVVSQLGLNRFRNARQSQEALVDLDSQDFSGRQGFGIELRQCR